MNKAIIMGRLTRDPEIRWTQAGNSQEQMCIARYTLAVDRRQREAGADFIPVVAFGKAGEFAEKYFKKGTKLVVTGRIQTGSYEKDGRTVYTTDVIASRVEFLGGRAAEVDDGEPSKNIESPEQISGFEAVEGDIPF